MNPKFGLTEADRDRLDRMIKDWEGRVQSLESESVWDDKDPAPAPDLYLAQAPSGGIPAMTVTREIDDGTGTGTSTEAEGTGTEDEGTAVLYTETVTPGKAICRLYALKRSSDTVGRGGVKSETVYNAGEEIAPDTWVLVGRDRPGVWWVLEIGITPDAGPATTTTAQPDACSGVCRWMWDNATKLWSLLLTTCAGYCVCTRPQFCGSEDCEATQTYCAPDRGPDPPFCGGQTTTTGAPDGTTTTTTAPSSGCSGGCTWRCKLGSWVRIVDLCLSSCPCPEPTTPCSGDSGDCSLASTSCGPVIVTTTPAPSCAGSCPWYFDPDTLSWVRVNQPGYGCVYQGVTTCYCPVPSAPGSPCSVTYTACISDTTVVTTTTSAPTACTGSCWFRWSVGSGLGTGTGTDDEGFWSFLRTNCPSFCGCPWEPPFDGLTDCDTAAMPCSPTTSTTTSTTTTCAPTTTTAAPVCGTCEVHWGGSSWGIRTQSCASGCSCAVPTDAGNMACDRVRVIGCSANCTSTTTPCPTTTTEAPPYCGECEYLSVNGPLVAGCPTYVWSLMSANCWCPAGGCPDVTSVCVQEPGLTMQRNCVGTTTTTTTTTTAAPVCTPTTSTTTTCGPQCSDQDGVPMGCAYLYHASGFWEKVLDDCDRPRDGASCFCPPAPTGLGCPGTTVTAACQDCVSTTSTTTTTTPAPGSCGDCSYKYFESLGWVLFGNRCTGSCSCPAAPGAPGDPGEPLNYSCV